jgi:tetratricopeptide (TPR) repeat protein
MLIAPIYNARRWLHLEQRELDAATKAFSEAFEISRQTGVRVEVAQALRGLAQVAAVQGGHESARRYAAERLSILEAI